MECKCDTGSCRNHTFGGLLCEGCVKMGCQPVLELIWAVAEGVIENPSVAGFYTQAWTPPWPGN